MLKETAWWLLYFFLVGKRPKSSAVHSNALLQVLQV